MFVSIDKPHATVIRYTTLRKKRETGIGSFRVQQIGASADGHMCVSNSARAHREVFDIVR
jgi:hypothetical protein